MGGTARKVGKSEFELSDWWHRRSNRNAIGIARPESIEAQTRDAGNGEFGREQCRCRRSVRKGIGIAGLVRIENSARVARKSEFRWKECGRYRPIRNECGVAGLATIEDPARDTCSDFVLDSFFEYLTEFFAEIGDAVETRLFKTFQTSLRKRQQRIEWRMRTAHGSALPGLWSPQQRRQGRNGNT